MFKTGLFVGKFMPPHIGHKQASLDASKLCDKLILNTNFRKLYTKKKITAPYGRTKRKQYLNITGIIYINLSK